MAAIQFPPVFPGDPQPVDGDTYLYIPNKEEYVCHRASMAQTPQWTQKGVISDSTFAYQGIANLASSCSSIPNRFHLLFSNCYPCC
jgi:hypothetical protein